MIFKTIKELVQGILLENEEARNSDKVLYMRVLAEYAVKDKEDYLKMPTWVFWSTVYGTKVPSIESVGRCRRKIQEKYPQLRASEEVQASRKALEEEYREFARG